MNIKKLRFQVKSTISHLRKSPKDAWYYIQGTLREAAYNSSNLRWLLRKHIIEQYEWRRDVKANPCFKMGSCWCCGCDTPSLFFANKSCSVEKLWHCHQNGQKNCYPAMMTKAEWKRFKTQTTTKP